MIPTTESETDESTYQKLCINQNEQENGNGEAIQQNYNYPQFQPYPQQQQNNYVINQPPQYPQQYQNYVQVVPQNANADTSPLHFHNGQKKAFTISIVSIWILQILIELSLLHRDRDLILDTRITVPCFIAAIIILIFTLYENHPNYKRKEISYQDQILFFIFFAVDIFTNFAIYYYINTAEFNFFLILFRIYLFGNLICSIFTLLTTKRELKIRGIIVYTLIPFIAMMIIVYMVDHQYNGQWGLLYLIPFSWQIVQFGLSYNLLRVINEIYTKQNSRIDINNIYTGFILFKYSYYIPF